MTTTTDYAWLTDTNIPVPNGKYVRTSKLTGTIRVVIAPTWRLK